MKPNTKIIRLYTINMFTRIGNKCLFFSIDDDHVKLIENEVKPGHKVHIFDLCEASIMNNLEKFINKIPDKVKVYIHVPKTNMNIKNLVEIISKNYSNVRIITEKYGPVFVIDYNNRRNALYSVNYTDEGIITRIELDCYKVKYSSIDIFDEKYKEAVMDIAENLIADFKKNCPPGILSSFKSDKDILNYIFETADISISVKEENE